ncbi:MAG: hypothetical protein ACYC0V_16165 [Armatimonadota bacterium]
MYNKLLEIISQKDCMFNYTDNLKRLICHITANMHEFNHIKPDQLHIAFSQSKVAGVHGVYATVHPLRFENGSLTTVRRNRTYRCPTIVENEKEILYIITFYLPRFANLDFEVKLLTIFHELFHISPLFNGDIRRFPGKNYAHGHSRKKYDDSIGKYVKAYLLLPGAVEESDFFRFDFNTLEKKHGSIRGHNIRIPRPFLVKQ